MSGLDGGRSVRVLAGETRLLAERMGGIGDAIGFRREKKLSGVEAAGLPGISERHFRELRDAHKEKGALGRSIVGAVAPRIIGSRLHFNEPRERTNYNLVSRTPSARSAPI